MRTFKLIREKDLSGVSGTGIVAEGIEFTDGTTVIRWLSSKPNTGIYNSLRHVLLVHGHEGTTWAQLEDGSKIQLR